MPPKPKYTREEIIAAAFQLARERGIEAVVAREVGKRLGTSSSPIFTVFNSMEELQRAVIDLAWRTFEECISIADGYNPAFKMRGMQFIHFAQQEPKLFQMLFMREQKPLDFETLMESRIHGFEQDVERIRQDYHLSFGQARRVFNHVWVHAYGICVLCATGICAFNDEELNAMLGEAFMGEMLVLKRGGGNHRVIPAAKGSEEAQRLGGTFPGYEEM